MTAGKQAAYYDRRLKKPDLRPLASALGLAVTPCLVAALTPERTIIVATTRIYRFHDYGGPDKLKLEAVPLPDPGPGDVRVKVQAMSLNRADMLWLANQYIETPKLPSRLGYEVAGVVEAVGHGVTAFKAGDRVSTLPAFSISDYANFGETALIPDRGLMPTPERFSPAEGASFAFAYFTGYFGLYELARLQPGQTVLVTAATSTTGLAAIPLAQLLDRQTPGRSPGGRSSSRGRLRPRAPCPCPSARSDKDRCPRAAPASRTGGPRACR